MTAPRNIASELVRREVAPHLRDWEDAGEVPRSLHLERHYRDARILPIAGGATEVLTDLAARLLGCSS